MQYIAAAPINRLRTGRPKAIIEGPNSKMILCVCLTAISVGAKAASIPGDVLAVVVMDGIVCGVVAVSL